MTDWRDKIEDKHSTKIENNNIDIEKIVVEGVIMGIFIAIFLYLFGILK